MFKAIKEFFVGKTPAERHPLDAVTTPNIPEPVMVTETVVVSAPYKVEPPAATISIPLVVETAPVLVVEAAPEKKVRKPRAPKSVVVKEKAPAKAKAPKLTVVKAVKSKKV